jgi:DNA-binding transcriptional MerR regulator
MKSELEYGETTGSIARGAGCLPETVRRFADTGLIDFRRLADGTRVFRADAAGRVREIMAERRGRQSKKTA